ncbi:hypothetical protein ACVWXR_001444 [Pseudomonas lurida]
MTRRILRPALCSGGQCTHPQAVNRAQDAHSDILSGTAGQSGSVT